VLAPLRLEVLALQLVDVLVDEVLALRLEVRKGDHRKHFLAVAPSRDPPKCHQKLSPCRLCHFPLKPTLRPFPASIEQHPG
jgi:hypothetical protein